MKNDSGKGRAGAHGRTARQDIDLQLEALLGRVGETLGDLFERLEAGETGDLRHGLEVRTSRGPVRVEAGLSLRMGLGETAQGARERDVAHPVRSPGTRSSASQSTQPAPADLAPGRELRADDGTDAPGLSQADQPAGPRQGTLRPDRQLEIDIYECDGRWIWSADMPGVSLPEVSVAVAPDEISVSTTGRRRYAGRHALPKDADPSDMEIALRNGVLEISMGRSAEGGAAR